MWAAALSGLIFGPLGIVFAILSRGNRVSCPFCKESIHEEATVCPLGNFQVDVESGLLQRVPYDMEKVFRVAGELSGKYTASIGCRTLDILHVAVAKVIEAKIFVTLDARQAAVAAKAGLKVLPARKYLV